VAGLSHHWIKLDDSMLDLILTLDPEDVAMNDDDLVNQYRKWAETVRQAIEDGLETA
jgi:hypothetical protein